MRTITCKISERLDSQLEDAARRRRVSKSTIVREALTHRLIRRGRGLAPSAFDLVKRLAGSVRGPADLSSNPKHLEGLGA